MDTTFDLFLETVGEHSRDFVQEIHDFLLQNGCKCDIKSAKSGYMVSYVLRDTKKTVANFVFRKSGIKMRLYLEHAAQYQDFLDTLPDAMKKEIKKAPICKRLANPGDCNSKCGMGYSFEMDREPYQKCRYHAFMPTLNDENNPFIRLLLERELECRADRAE